MANGQTSFEIPLQHVDLEEIAGDGFVLDVGAGGEGFISRIAGKRVCAVDIAFNKIREARIHGTDSTWIASDGRRLCFRNASFPTATLCFSLGYFPEWNEKREVLQEIHRVLKNGGVLILYFMHILVETDSFLFRGQFTLPDTSRAVMSYRVKGNQNQSQATVIPLLESSGLDIVEIDSHEYWSMAIAQKETSPKP